VASTQAAFQLLTARLSGSDDPYTTHFWTGLIGCVALFSAVLPAVLPSIPAVLGGLSGSQWLSLGFIGLAASVGHLFLIFALEHAPVPVLMPATYVQIPVAALVGWMVFHHAPEAWTALGMGCVAVVGVGAVWAGARARAA
jgi:drug/metabolite transporter (DMT)-like permease